MREYQDMQAEPLDYMSAKPVSEDDMLTWIAVIKGPAKTRYEGKEYEVELKFKDDYPFSPPSVKFLTPIKHPHVIHGGRVCLDTLGYEENMWSPANTIISVLNTVLALLDTDHGDDDLTTRNYGKQRYETDPKFFDNLDEFAFK